MSRLFVIEARRIFPLLFLLVLLVSLTLYDGIRQQVTPVMDEAQIASGEINFDVIEKGDVSRQPKVHVFYEEEQLKHVAKELSLAIPEYPLQEGMEAALMVVNGNIKGIESLSEEEGYQARVTIKPKANKFQLVTVPLEAIDVAGTSWQWVFVDDKDEMIAQFPGPGEVSASAMEEAEAEEEEEDVIK